MQRVTPGVGDAFGPVEVALKEIFVPALFQGLQEGVPELGITRLPVKQAGLALPDPSQTAPENWTASCVITGHLFAALRGQVEFRLSPHGHPTLPEAGAPVFAACRRRRECKTRAPSSAAISASSA